MIFILFVSHCSLCSLSFYHLKKHVPCSELSVIVNSALVLTVHSSISYLSSLCSYVSWHNLSPNPLRNRSYYCRLFYSEFALEQKGNEPQLWSYCINVGTALCFFLGSVWLNRGGLQRWIPCSSTFHGH